MNLTIPFTSPIRKIAVSARRGSLLRGLAILTIKSLGKPRLPKGLREIRPMDRPDITFTPCDSMVMDAVYWFGVQGYEGLMGEVWPLLCKNARNILEIGGNVGIYGVIGGLATQGQYTIVEPVPHVARILRNNLDQNGLASRVDLIEAAVVPSDLPGKVLLEIPAEGRGAPVGAHLSGAVGIEARTTETMIEVESIPFSALVENRDLIKIDAEGIEEALLESVRPRLVADKPTLVLEVLPEARGLAKFISSLAREAGMVISVIPSYGKHRVTQIRPEEFGADTPARFNSKDVVVSLLAKAESFANLSLQ